MKIIECLWKDQFVEKLAQKHQVSVEEVEEVFANAPRFNFISNGNVDEEDVYWALGRTDAGRYLTIFFIYKGGGLAMPISARDMNTRERRRYGKK